MKRPKKPKNKKYLEKLEKYFVKTESGVYVCARCGNEIYKPRYVKACPFCKLEFEEENDLGEET